MPDNIYLLRIMDGSRCVAEAPLTIHDPEAAWQIFSEGFGNVIAQVAGGVYNVVMIACNAELRAKLGSTALDAVAFARPSSIVMPIISLPKNPNGRRE